MSERGDLLLAAGGAGGDRAMESAVQHGTAPFVTGLQAPGTRSNLAAATGAWRYGKRSAFPTSPHPRRRRTNVERRVTLTFHLVQKICQVTRLLNLINAYTTTANHEAARTALARIAKS